VPDRGYFAWADEAFARRALFDTLQGQPWKMTETRPRLRWASRPVGMDNASVTPNYLGIGKVRLDTLRKQQII